MKTLELKSQSRISSLTFDFKKVSKNQYIPTIKCYSSYIQFMKQSKFEVDRMKDENDRFFAFLKVVEKENKDDQIFKQGFDSLLKEGAFLF